MDVAHFSRRVEQSLCAVEVRQTQACTVRNSADELRIVEIGTERGDLGVVMGASFTRGRVAGELDGLFGEEQVRQVGVQEGNERCSRDLRGRLELRTTGVVQEADSIQK